MRFSMPPSSFDPDALPFRRVVIAGLACVVAVVAGAMLADQPYLIFAGLAGLLYVGTLTVNARALAWLVIALQPAALIVPFFPGRPFWWELCALLAWPSLLAYGLVNRRKIELVAFDRAERWALAALGGYLVVLLGLMAYRGVGFRAFGGAQMGGRFYTQQLILAILPLLMLTANFSKKNLLKAVAVGWAMALTYLVSDFSFSLGGGTMQRILYFFELPTDALNFELGYEITGMRRYQSLWYAAAAGLACLWTLVPLRDLLGRYFLLTGPLMLGLLGMGLGSGHRTLLVLTLSTLILLSFFQRFWTAGRAITALILICGGLGVLYQFADELPLPAQRSISFLPAIKVQPLAQRDAKETLDDRIEILKLAIDDIPRYALVGRGFGMERFDQLPDDAVNTGVWRAYVNGFFYNGTLGVLLKTGVPGFIVTSLFVWWLSRMAIELVRCVNRGDSSQQTNFDRLCLLVSAQWFSTVGFFYLMHGDAGTWMQVFALQAGLIMACRRLKLADASRLVSADAQPSAQAG
jgi:hypothetical protein